MSISAITNIAASDVISQDNANLFWDNAANRLGIGINSPTAVLHVEDSVSTGNNLVHFDNRYGGGGGTVFSYALIIVYSQTILQAAGNRKLPILTGQILATVLFVRAGYVHYPLAIAMLIANTLGGWFGSRFFLRKGDKKVRIFFFGIILLLGFKTLFF